MKAINILGHPVLLISIYLLLIIEGRELGGLYILYLLLALPHGAGYAVLAVSGIALLLLGYKIRRKEYYLFRSALYLVGLVLMIWSLVLFFSKGGKQATFELTIPLLSFILFGLCCLCFLIRTVQLLAKNKTSALNITT